MKAYRFFLFLVCGLALTSAAGAQITYYDDSTSFDDAFGRLREIDFEDVYSATVQRITFRNPWGLNCMAIGSFDPTDPADSAAIAQAPRMLWLGQGATIDFPTRTRRVEMFGYSHPFRIRLTDFNDSSFMLELDTFPKTVSSPAGIKRIQFFGDDPDGSINWTAGFQGINTFDENGDTLASSEFRELQGEKAYILNRAVSSNFFFPDDTTFYSPVDVHGIKVMEPEIGFAGSFMFDGEARIDPDNPIGNLSIELTPGGWVEFPAGTEGAMIVLERFHIADSAWFEVRDDAGNVDTVMVDGIGRPFDSAWVEDQRYTYIELGMGSPDGIEKITFLGNLGATGTIALATVFVAEVPTTEIARIDGAVASLDSAGFLGVEDEGRLRVSLDQAIAAVKVNDRAKAISLLQTFRNDVQEMGAKKILVPEEEKLFAADAAYVITRLGAASGVRTVEEAAAAGVRLGEPIVGADRVRIDCAVPAGADASVGIYALDGSLVRMLSVSGGSIAWDLSNGDGERVPAGVYVINLRAAGLMDTKLVRIVR